MIFIKKAVPEDAEELTTIAIKVFLNDNKLKPVGASLDGPPGHNEVDKQRDWILNTFYYKAIYNDKIVGGGLAWVKNDDEYRIDGMFIDPNFQNKGIGSTLIKHIIDNHHPRKKWTLETPDFSVRNQHFYEKHGFKKLKIEKNDECGWSDIYYERCV
ncbi:MAG: GNAT family N-acetyltransferase [Chloroflexi bacterium]|nr:GNAT family N-acetyltransferase [Chloroflexota bacterium]MBE3114269.1 GNAT family N-acetyltransferase [Actinomycetota bacterium]